MSQLSDRVAARFLGIQAAVRLALPKSRPGMQMVAEALDELQAALMKKDEPGFKKAFQKLQSVAKV